MISAAINTSGWESFFQLIGVLLVFIFVLVVTYFCTRFIANYQKGVTSNKNIRVIETFRVTSNKFIQIIEVGRAYFVIAVSKDMVTLLGKIDKEELIWLPDRDTQSPMVKENFHEILHKLKDKLPRK